MRVKNPIIRADMPDPDILLLNGYYYMVSTTMFLVPGAPVLKSKDLVNWEIISYVYTRLEDNEFYNLENGKNAYGYGQWATSLFYENGKVYACFVCHAIKKTFIFSTENIEESNWKKTAVIDEVYHDMSFLEWKGKKYLIYGNGEIHIVQLKDDFTGSLKETDRVLFQTEQEKMWLMCEGCRAFKHNGYIYLLFIDRPAGEENRRRELCYRAADIDGPYEHRVILDDDAGYFNQGVAQGTCFQTMDGSWKAIMFQDRGSVGRIPYIIDMVWKENWPVLGSCGEFTTNTAVLPDEWNPMIRSDSFDHVVDKLDLIWQWNHNPDNNAWSFTAHKGCLTLFNRTIASDLLHARNTLTQRTSENKCSFEVTMNTQHMKTGDYAGLCAFMSQYGQIGVELRDDGRYLVVKQRNSDKKIEVIYEQLIKENKIHLKVEFDFTNRRDKALFYWKAGDDTWIEAGRELNMQYTLDLFIGYRIGIFSYPQVCTGGCTEFTDFIAKQDE